MDYTALQFANKGMAWRVYKKVRDGLRVQNKPLNSVKIKNATVLAEKQLVDRVEQFADKFNFRYKTETV